MPIATRLFAFSVGLFGFLVGETVCALLLSTGHDDVHRAYGFVFPMLLTAVLQTLLWLGGLAFMCAAEAHQPRWFWSATLCEVPIALWLLSIIFGWSG